MALLIVCYLLIDACYCVLQSSSRFDELPDELDPIGKLPGSFDDGDPQTTNLYVGNLSPKVGILQCACFVYT